MELIYTTRPMPVLTGEEWDPHNLPVNAQMYEIRNWASILQPNTLDQIKMVGRAPAVHGIPCAMADAHPGEGCVVGMVIPTKDKIAPAWVGVDIGCGMIAVLTNLTRANLPENLGPLHGLFREAIPAGVGRQFDAPTSAAQEWLEKNPPPMDTSERNMQRRIEVQLGTLGSGNHFLEVCVDLQERIWIVVHSGSRAVGMWIANRYIKVAQQECKDAGIELEDPAMAYLYFKNQTFYDYINEMTWAQNYALANREAMMDAALGAICNVRHGAVDEIQRINCHHNFTTQERHSTPDGNTEMLWITRKGAIRAYVNDWGIIPGSMATATYIVKGKANEQSYCSSAHGAGRMMSRTEARKTFTEDSLEKWMVGKTWNDRDVKALLDEHPEAYKDVDKVMRDQADLVEVQETLRQILNFKGADEPPRRRDRGKSRRSEQKDSQIKFEDGEPNRPVGNPVDHLSPDS